MKDPTKTDVKNYWNETPNATEEVNIEEGTLDFYEVIEDERYKLEPFIHSCAQFTRWHGKRVLEVGCGIGTDFIQFARAGADVYGVDLTPKAIELLKKRLKLYDLNATNLVGDAESLPFQDNIFDLVYSWGVIHHTPNTEKTIEDIYRTLKPGGKITIMVYHKFSWLYLLIFLRYGILGGELLFRSFQEIISQHTESADQKNPLTKAYSIKETKKMFNMFSDVKTEVFLTPYDQTDRLPSWLTTLFSKKIGWFLVIKAIK
jgi:ubiquinone/menaquinone biosynthesis C-methylase UbiE